MTITSLKELKEIGYLKHGDILEFCDGNQKFIYKCMSRYLYHMNGINSKIFQYLDIKYKNQFCVDLYGYCEAGGLQNCNFPECKTNDYEALYRVAMKLYEMFESRGIDGFICTL